MSLTLLNLPLELVDHIVSFIGPTNQKSLSNLSLTCRTLYHCVTPVLYRTLRIHFSGRDSWPHHAATILALAPPGSFKLPDSLPPPNDYKGKGVVGQPSQRPAACRSKEASLTERRLATTYIRNISISGFWTKETERDGSASFAKDDIVDQTHEPFLQALEGLLYSIEELQSFEWHIILEISPRVGVALSRFDSLKILDVNCDTHMIKMTPHFMYQQSNQPSIPVMDPSPLAHLSLARLHINQLGDFNQAIHYGDVIRSPTNWRSLRHIEVDISRGFMNTIVELEPMDPDILFSLFRAPPPPRGFFETPKMQLETIKIRDLSLFDAGMDAFEKAVDPSTLKELDLQWCHDGSNILKLWANNKLTRLEKLVLKEQKSLTLISKQLKQFGSEGKSHNLKHLDLSCHARRSEMMDPYFFDMEDPDSDSDDYDDDDDMLLPNDFMPQFHLAFAGGPGGPIVVPPPPHALPQFLAGLAAGSTTGTPVGPSSGLSPPKDIDPFPPVWKTLRDLRGSKEEGWGLESLFLDFADPIPVHKQGIFFDGFWNLHYLATPVSYDSHDNWPQFVESIAALPNLHALFILNRRSPPAYALHGHHHFPPDLHITFGLAGGGFGGAGSVTTTNLHAPIFPPTPRPSSSRRANNGKRKTKGRAAEDPPDQAYIDALSIAAANRLPSLYSSTNATVAPSSPTPSSSAFAPFRSSPSSSFSPSPVSASHPKQLGGKLEYIAIPAHPVPGSPYTISRRSLTRVWKVVVKKAPMKKVEVELDEKSLERKRSLRSSTLKKRKVEEPGDWRVKREGDWEVSLMEVKDMEQKKWVANGWFKERVRSDWGNWAMF